MAKSIPGTPYITSVKEVAYVSTCPPRKSGIATFTADLVNSIGRLSRLRDQRFVSIDGRRMVNQSSAESNTKLAVNGVSKEKVKVVPHGCPDLPLGLK